MIAIDTNVLVRYLVGDDPIQAAQAKELIDGAFTEGDSVWLTHIVLCETVWVLETSYRVGRKPLAEMLRRVVDSFSMADREQVIEAIRDYEHGPADFADYLLGRLGRQAGSLTTYTFDKALRKNPAFTVLK
jgi:predicted nucleic-acid-binding protein